MWCEVERVIGLLHQIILEIILRYVFICIDWFNAPAVPFKSRGQHVIYGC